MIKTTEQLKIAFSSEKCLIQSEAIFLCQHKTAQTTLDACTTLANCSEIMINQFIVVVFFN